MASIKKRETNNGKVHYRVQIRLKGFPSQSATFKTKTHAKQWAQKTEAAMREGRYFKTIESKRHTLGDMVDRYVKNHIKEDSRYHKDIKRQLQWWKIQIGDYLLSDVTPALIVELREKLLNEETETRGLRSPSTIVRYMAALSKSFSIAIKEWGWQDDPPMRKVTKPKEPKGRVRYLSESERANLLKVCKESDNKYLYTIVVLALATGMRKSEIMNLTWDDVDLYSQRIILKDTDTKNSEYRNVPIKHLALDLLKELSKIKRIDTNLLFPGKFPDRPAYIRRPWNNALKTANIKDFRFHDLRHTAASYLAMNGASMAEIADILGHKTLQMSKRYSHLSEPHKAKVIEDMNAKIFGG